MAQQATILLVDDEAETRDLIAEQLGADQYRIVTASSGEAALALLDEVTPDLVITDVQMRGIDGIELCARLKGDPQFQLSPVILLTGLGDVETRVAGLSAGADDFFAKPVDHVVLKARVASLLRMKSLLNTITQLHETVQAQAAELAEGKRTLEERVQDQIAQLERLGRLKRFLSPQLAEMIVGGGAEDPLRTHRSDVTVAFVDLRGFTAFAETSEPEEVMAVLQEYHGEMGRIVLAHEGTLERYTGDGMMILFNDPLPIPNPVERAIRMALQMREREKALSKAWHRRGFELNFGIGIAQGYATIGTIGFEGRWDYTAIGTVVNLAARLCGSAKPGQILVPQRLVWTVEDVIDSEHVSDFNLKGFSRPVPAYNVLGLKESRPSS